MIVFLQIQSFRLITKAKGRGLPYEASPFRPLFVLPKNRGRKKFPPGFLDRLLKFSNNFGTENLRFFLVFLCRDPFCDASAARSFALAGSICGCPLCFHHRLCVIGPFCCRILAAARVFCLCRLLERIFPICRFPFYQSNRTQSFCSRPRLYSRKESVAQKHRVLPDCRKRGVAF